MWQTILWLLLGGAILIALVLIYGARRWRAITQRLHADLEAARRPIASEAYDPEELNGLPEPVQRYFRCVLVDGQARVWGARIEHRGTFNLSDSGERWRGFSSTQKVVTHRPGFDWEARIAMLPGLEARVHDVYSAGEGLLCVSLFGLLSLVNEGGPDVAHGELMRYLAEAAWYPTALLPSQGIRWTAVDDTSADATLWDGDTTVTLRFRFAADGLIDSVHTEARGRLVGDAVIPTPWRGRWTRWEWRAGMRIPIEGEVAWMLADGPQTYWRGRIETIRYQLAASPPQSAP
ncbi:MAG: DUF6544 family protein [Acidobacteriota bacterium]